MRKPCSESDRTSPERALKLSMARSNARRNFVGHASANRHGVRVITLHQAKSLEFPVVFMPALEEDTLPHYFAVRDGPAAIEEERRLLYVAVTRATKRLFLTSSARRRNHKCEIGRFLRELPFDGSEIEGTG
jgi:superfamily I DNA/RNA helicase